MLDFYFVLVFHFIKGFIGCLRVDKGLGFLKLRFSSYIFIGVAKYSVGGYATF